MLTLYGGLDIQTMPYFSVKPRSPCTLGGGVAEAYSEWYTTILANSNLCITLSQLQRYEFNYQNTLELFTTISGDSLDTLRSISQI